MRQCWVCRESIDMIEEPWLMRNGSGEIAHIYHRESRERHMVTCSGVDCRVCTLGKVLDRINVYPSTVGVK